MRRLQTKIYKRKFAQFESSLLKFLASKKFFLIIMLLFILQSGWIAVSAQYPLIYDEGYHVGAINAYEGNLLPFISHQNESDSGLGDITRYGSYLYHYVMSFPARIIDWLHGSLYVKIEILRWLNIGIFAVALLYMYQLLFKLGFSRKNANITILAVTMIPITTYVAATINYDSMFLLFIMVHLVAAIRLYELRYSDAKTLVAYISTGILGSLTKYSFLPIFMATFLVSLVILWHQRDMKQACKRLLASIRAQSRTWQVILGVVTIVVLGLFAERYGYNVVAYRSVNPDCGRIHSVQSCEQWGPWRRNYVLDVEYPDDKLSAQGAVKFFVNTWYDSIIRNSTLIGGTAVQEGYVTHALSSQLSLKWLYLTVVGCVSFAFLAAVALIKSKRLVIVLAAVIAYLISFFMLNYSDFSKLGEPVAVQARYVLWIAPVIISLTIYTLSSLFMSLYKKAPGMRTLVVLAAFIVMMQFGGIMTYWLKYQPSWSWKNQPVVVQVNTFMNKVANKMVVGN